MKGADLYCVEKELHYRALMSAAEDSPHGVCGTDDEPYKSARVEPDDASSIKLLEQDPRMSLLSDTGSKDDMADDSDDSRHMTTSNKECRRQKAK